MEFHSFRFRSEERRLNIAPFGDLQKGAPGFRGDQWQRWKEERRADRKSLLIGVGDYTDFLRPKMREALTSTMMRDPSVYSQMDDLVQAGMDKLVAELAPFKGRIIGLLEGHHYHRFYSGITSTQYLCNKLRVKYLGFVAGIRLEWERATGHANCIDIFATHGCGGASKVSQDIAAIETKIRPGWNVDIILRGHSTRCFCVHAQPMRELRMGKTGVLGQVERQCLIVNAGGFMDAYIPGQSSYVEEKNLPHLPLGWPIIELQRMNNHGQLGRRTIEIRGTAYIPQKMDMI